MNKSIKLMVWGLVGPLAVGLAGCSSLPDNLKPAILQLTPADISATANGSSAALAASPTTAAPTAKPPAATDSAPAATSQSAAPSATPAAAARFGLLADLKTNVSVRLTADGKDHAGQFGEALPVGAQVVTDPTGKARIVMENGSTVRLGPNTQLVLVDRQQQSSGLQTQLQLLIGKLWVILGRDAGETLQVETSVGVAAVNGSYMSVDYQPGKPDDTSDDVLQVTCLEGSCSLTVNGQTIKFTTHQKIRLEGKGGKLKGPEAMSSDDIQEWLDNNDEILIEGGNDQGQNGTETPEAPGGSTLPTKAPAAGVPWPGGAAGRPDGLAIVVTGIVLGVAGGGWLKRRK